MATTATIYIAPTALGMPLLNFKLAIDCGEDITGATEADCKILVKKPEADAFVVWDADFEDGEADNLIVTVDGTTYAMADLGQYTFFAYIAALGGWSGVTTEPVYITVKVIGT